VPSLEYKEKNDLMIIVWYLPLKESDLIDANKNIKLIVLAFKNVNNFIIIVKCVVNKLFIKMNIC